MSSSTAAGPLRVIMGPTAAGKSAIALTLAERYGATIISADSRQLYRGFDIGTAKPTAEEQTRVPHLGLDVLDPTDRASSHWWGERAREWIGTLRGVGREPLVVGGTGFYVRALVTPLDPMPTLDATARAALEPWLNGLASNELTRWCEQLDPARAHLGATQKRRAIETVLLSGRRLSDEFVAHNAITRENGSLWSSVRYLVVDPGAVLAQRIADRVRMMVRAGWLDETRALLETVAPDAPAWSASGYQVMRSAARGEYSIDAAIERVTIETRQYAKRQRTWCRHQIPVGEVTWLDGTAADAMARAIAWWDTDTEEGR
ncbi:MAG: tRNA (adenosine(37)-N6)-dimethylallyltransferase MiaA [Gemmatimonadaceae bacterium]|nr:tRNA (adenosine(37)-N6)-dimethylallyltransferase MiaA [Gemmatimonadaceae bacterium]